MRSQTTRQSENGFSLMELLVVMSVMLVTLGAAMTLMKDALKVGNTTFELTDAQESLRTAHEFINRDLVTAGDGLNGMNNFQVPQAFVNAYLSQASFTDPNRASYVSLPIIKSDPNVPGTVAVPGATPAATVLAGTDRITILSVDPTFIPVSIAAGGITGNGATASMALADLNKLVVNEIYCMTSGSAQAFVVVTAKNTSGTGAPSISMANLGSLGLNQPVSTGPLNLVGNAPTTGANAGISTLPVSMIRVQINHYYINDRKQFVQRVFGVPGQSFVDNIIAEHIVGLNLRYLLGTENADGSIPQPVENFADATQQGAVRQVEVTLTAETTHMTNYSTVNGNTSGARNRISMTTTTSVRNLQFRQAQQPTAGG